MGLSVGSIIYVALLSTNAIAILNEERFLARIGWSSIPPPQQQQQQNVYHNPYEPTGQVYRQEESVKTKIVNLIGAVRTLMRFPLIFLNIAVIIYELILG